MQNRHLVAHPGRLADNQPGGVIEHNALTEARGRVNIHAEFGADSILEEQGQGLPALIPQPVRHAMRLQGVKTLVVQKGDVQLMGCRVAVQHRQQIGAHGVRNRAVGLEGLQYHFAQQQR